MDERNLHHSCSIGPLSDPPSQLHRAAKMAEQQPRRRASLVEDERRQYLGEIYTEAIPGQENVSLNSYGGGGGEKLGFFFFKLQHTYIPSTYIPTQKKF